MISAAFVRSASSSLMGQLGITRHFAATPAEPNVDILRRDADPVPGDRYKFTAALAGRESSERGVAVKLMAPHGLREELGRLGESIWVVETDSAGVDLPAGLQGTIIETSAELAMATGSAMTVLHLQEGAAS